MTHNCKKRCWSASAVALSSILLLPSLACAQQAAPLSGGATKLPEPESASRGQRSLVREIKYGDWQKFCFKTPGSNLVCRTTISGAWDTGQTAVRVDLIEREGDDKSRLQLFLPVGMYLQAGVKLTVDQGKPYLIPYVWCMTNICIAGNAADPELIHEMENGQKLTLEVVDSSVQSVDTTLPLGQFGPIRKDAPSRTYQQEIDE
jgi:invasion protein IalB